MAILSKILHLAFLVSLTQALPTRRAEALEVATYNGETSGRYIVTLKEGIKKSTTFDSFKLHRRSGALNVTHEWDAAFFNGFAGEFDEAALEDLRANNDVAAIEEDGLMYANAYATQTNAPWNLARLSSVGTVVGNPSTYTYSSSAGAGVDIYIIDTGILITHTQFGGRARWGATFGGYANTDGNGHGTHCAGIAASTTYGVAKSASLIAVKVLSDAGSGTISDIISGLNYVATAVAGSSRPSVASLSLGGSISAALDNAATSLVNSGVPLTVAAGNGGTDASNTSPARASAVITVAASTNTNTIYPGSNYGPVIDIFAPGTNIISTSAPGNTATSTVSGTSAAAPHVAGLIAYFISLFGPGTPAQLQATLEKYALKNVLTGIPAGTKNLLAHNEVGYTG